MQLTLIRHSKTTIQLDSDNKLWTLSDEGVEAAQNLAQNKDIQNLDLIYSSLQNKALETTVILAKPNHIPIKTDPNLTESTSITNGSIPDYEQTVSDYLAGKIQNINGGEQVEEAYNRFLKAITEILDTNPKVQNVGIVTHGVILSILTSRYTNFSAKQVHSVIQMPDYAVFDWDSKNFTKLFTKLK